MDRLSEHNAQAVIAAHERVAIAPPDELQGEARALFVAIADGNRSRPWNAAHSHALADYCRVAILWGEAMDEVTREGIVIGNKPNPRLRALAVLSSERQRLAQILGLQVGSRDRYLGGGGKNEERARNMGALMAEGSATRTGHMLD